MHLLTIVKDQINRELIATFVRSKMIGENKGSFLGTLWIFLYPILIMMVYAMIFGYIFDARQENETIGEYTLVVFSGWLFYQTFTENIQNGSRALVSNRKYLTKINFPKKILVISTTVYSFIKQIVFYLIFMAYFIILKREFTFSFFYLPLLILAYTLFCYSLSVFVSALTPHFRDFTQMAGIINRALLYLSPIFYTVEHFEKFGYGYLTNLVLAINPLAAFITLFRWLLIGIKYDQMWIPLLSIGIWTLLLRYIGNYIFKRVEKNVIDII